MTYKAKNINGKKNPTTGSLIKKAFPLVLLFAALIVVVFFRSAITPIILPLFKNGAVFYDSFFLIPEIFSDKNKIAAENQKLLEQNEKMRLRLLEYDSLNRENERLYRELGLKPLGNFTGAKVVAKYPQMPFDSLLLDKGEEDGVSKGDLVLAQDRIIVGQIVKVSPRSAVVALNSFPEIVAYAYVERTGEPIEVKGGGGGVIQSQVPIDFDIILGDKIMIEGTRTYIAGVVGSTEEDRSAGLKNTLISLPVNVSELRIVFIEPLVKE